MIEAKSNTKLRRNIISAFFHKGYCGPNCNLDDVSAYVTNYDVMNSFNILPDNKK